jgi:hypothetical protein
MTAFDEVAAAAAAPIDESGWFFTFRERMDGFRLLLLLSRTHEPDDELILPPDSLVT